MFRKMIHIIVSLLLLTTTMGFTVSKHYCHSRLVAISIDHEEKSCCDMGDNCCHNETKVFQLNENFVISPVIENNTIDNIDLLFPVLFVINEDIFSEDTKSTYQIPESPPPIKRQTVLSSLQTYLC